MAAPVAIGIVAAIMGVGIAVPTGRPSCPSITARPGVGCRDSTGDTDLRGDTVPWFAANGSGIGADTVLVVVLDTHVAGADVSLCTPGATGIIRCIGVASPCARALVPTRAPTALGGAACATAGAASIVWGCPATGSAACAGAGAGGVAADGAVRGTLRVLIPVIDAGCCRNIACGCGSGPGGTGTDVCPSVL
mmetsp:Transcript_102393/g.264749  ORF Transcript_102393/g.264749 Transcript_102393/m.264749 type:complete len:193 (-) Transcript_102393:86-664(-)